MNNAGYINITDKIILAAFSKISGSADHRRNGTLHVRRSAPVYPILRYDRTKGIKRPVLGVSDRDCIDMPVKQNPFPGPFPFQMPDHVAVIIR